MIEPFDIELNGIDYAVFPEENGVFAIFKDGNEYIKIQKDEGSWLKLDPETEIPRFEADEEVSTLGKLIQAELPEEKGG